MTGNMCSVFVLVASVLSPKAGLTDFLVHYKTRVKMSLLHPRLHYVAKSIGGLR